MESAVFGMAANDDIDTPNKAETRAVRRNCMTVPFGKAEVATMGRGAHLSRRLVP